MQEEENYTGPEASVYLECSRNHKESDVALENCLREDTNGREGHQSRKSFECGGLIGYFKDLDFNGDTNRKSLGISGQSYDMVCLMF